MYQMRVCNLLYNQKHTCAVTYLVKKDPCITGKVHSHSKLPVPEVESIDQIRRDIKEAKSNLQYEHSDEYHHYQQESIDAGSAS